MNIVRTSSSLAQFYFMGMCIGIGALCGCRGGSGNTQTQADPGTPLGFLAILAGSGSGITSQVHSQTSINLNGKPVSLLPTGLLHDTAVLPPPVVFLATDNNRLLVADTPVSPAANIVADPSDPNRFSVIVPNAQKFCAYQDSTTLCWAACTQTLLSQLNVHLNQERLAEEFVPADADDQTAGVGVVIRALNPDMEQEVDQRGVIPIDLIPITSDQLISELLAGHLCIVGLVEDKDENMGHACVVCGATFAKLKAGVAPTFAATAGQSAHDAAAQKSQWSPQYGLYSVQIFDPFKDKDGGMRSITAQSFSDQAAFITSHEIARETLLMALKVPVGTPLRPGQLAVKSKAYVVKEKVQSAKQPKTVTKANKAGKSPTKKPVPDNAN